MIFLNAMDAKLDYIVRELWILAWNGSVQRAKLYKEGVESNSESLRDDFREKIIAYLSSHVIPQYRKTVIAEEQHYTNIEDLIAYANSIDSQVLGQLGYKYGVAQKLLNLALKYQWCLGIISEPPHCPVDRIVINKTKYKNRINWTQMVARSEYQSVIEDIKRLARNAGQSPSMWELMIFNRR